mmetsp:Transcript_53181/g.156658  ORF Transcript_53181/g.156658 Transcript_53181/m.156658 type:complete len:83 (+) Transcript_53181:1336-1584(+)
MPALNLRPPPIVALRAAGAGRLTLRTTVGDATAGENSPERPSMAEGLSSTEKPAGTTTAADIASPSAVHPSYRYLRLNPDSK